MKWMPISWVENMKWMQRRIIGLDIDEDSFVFTELIKKTKEICLGKTGIFGNLKEFINDPLFKQTGVVIGLPTQRVLFRSFSIKSSLLKNRNKKKDIVLFLNRQNLPFKLEECLWATFVLNTHLNLIAVKKEVVEEYIGKVQNEGLRVLGVTPSLAALYNVFMYNYPEKEKDKSALLNIRRSASDLIIYETKRLWIYPIAVGKQAIEQTKDAQERLSLEVQRTFNAYYLQNPLAEKTSICLYLAGQDASSLVIPFKKVLGDFEIVVLEPLKKIILSQENITNPQLMSLSCGLALSYLNVPPCLNINFIEEKIRKEQYALQLNLLKKSAVFFIISAFIFLLLLDIGLFKNLKRQLSIYKNTQAQVSAILPRVKILKEEEEKLQNLRDFLEKSLVQQKLYLKVLVAISESKPPSTIIKEFNAEVKDEKLQVFISGSSATYEDINDFLNKLKKKDKDITEAKIVASTFPTTETEVKSVDFKLRFEIPGLVMPKIKTLPSDKELQSSKNGEVTIQEKAHCLV